MSDITGPISSLPGTGHALPKGSCCDQHPSRPAVARIQGETDSFGCELIDMCQECLDEERAYQKSRDARTGTCEWCGKPATDLRDTRDYDEGLDGPVYRACWNCRARRDREAQEELDRYEEEGGWRDWDD